MDHIPVYLFGVWLYQEMDAKHKLALGLFTCRLLTQARLMLPLKRERVVKVSWELATKISISLRTTFLTDF
jgi:hypothetical protein